MYLAYIMSFTVTFEKKNHFIYFTHDSLNVRILDPTKGKWAMKKSGWLYSFISFSFSRVYFSASSSIYTMTSQSLCLPNTPIFTSAFLCCLSVAIFGVASQGPSLMSQKLYKGYSAVLCFFFVKCM
ncbi:uncharacterized protein EV154DRAFT_512885 [Mucor mucedo]|uniref:uncharacterized protein n=1 Tax=Mucor mucedo TaxID=29922 RepID=UPI0022205C70|nr:uncharacterized protein EV154DRAFT_512885 [Mucor mucedo]KAI7889934.1 hypothetical protein EV154DRAFT_512885 [Mucor mucedo]